MTTIKIHIANILEINPGPIQCMSLNETILKLALFRGGNEPAIELWDVSKLPFRETVLKDLEKVDDNASVESIVWIKNRLFSCGLHGFVLEHDLSSGLIKGKTAATSGPVWCLGVSPNELFLAAGTEDGFVNIFQVYDEGLVYLKVLDRQEGRHLCLSWSPCGNYIATGSIDSLRLWDIEKGHALQRLMTGRSKNTETIVWSIVMLDDYLIVSGDSRGIICFWDGRVGVLKYKIMSHKADILCLKLSTDQNSIYAAGVDPLVVLLSRVGKSGDKWVKSHQRNIHTNDVMCLATHGNRLFSAGIDADLVMSSFPPKIVTKYSPISKPQNICMSKISKQILIQNGRSIDIWQLPGDNQELVKLLEFGTHRQDVINSACLNPSGCFFVYSTDDKINFFRLSMVTGSSSSSSSSSSSLPHALKPKPKLKKLSSSHISNELLDNLLVTSLHFINETIVLALSESNLIFFEIDTESDLVDFKSSHSLYTNELNENGDDEMMMMMMNNNGMNMISLVTTTTTNSHDDQYFYIGFSHNGNSIVSILKFNSKDLTFVSSKVVPKYHYQPTSLAFHSKLPYILITYIDHCIKIFNFSIGKIIYDEKLCKPNSSITTSSLQPILSSSWSQKGNRIILHEIDKLYLMKLEENDDESIILSKKIKKSSRSSFQHDDDDDDDDDLDLDLEKEKEKKNLIRNKVEKKKKLNFSIQTCENKYKFLAFVGFLDDGNELIVLEVKPSSLFEKLPPAFAKKRFGM